jgi:hypothetical protein
MSLEQATSILIQTGGAAFVLGLLNGLQTLLYECDPDGREQIERMRASRRLAKQEQMAALKRKDIEGAPLFSSDLAYIENALMKHARTKEDVNSTPKSLEQCFSGERGETCQLGTLGETYLKLDRLVMTLKEESVL